jgi:hypothetical protein
MNDDIDVPTIAEPFIQNGSALDGGSSELAAAKAKADENYNKFLLAMADFENYKKRVERQLGEISLAGKKSVLKKILPVLDNLERALTYAPGSEGLQSGLAATLRGFERRRESRAAQGRAVRSEIRRGDRHATCVQRSGRNRARRSRAFIRDGRRRAARWTSHRRKV